MHEALVGLGSNVEPDRHLAAAVRLLAERVEVRGVSAAWATPPVGPPGQPAFLNAAALVASDLSAERLRLDVLREVESALGRVRTADRFAPRTLDLDLVLYPVAGSPIEVLDPDLDREVHLAVPAAELLPAWVHPHTGETLSSLAERLLAALDASRRPRRTGLALGDRPGMP